MSNWLRQAMGPGDAVPVRLRNLAELGATWFWVRRLWVKRTMREAADEIVRLSGKCNALIDDLHVVELEAVEKDALIECLVAERNALQEQVKRLKQRPRLVRFRDPLKQVGMDPETGADIVDFDSPELEREIAAERRIDELDGKRDALSNAFAIIDGGR